MPAVSEMLAHDRGLRSNYFMLKGSRNSFSVFKRHAERLWVRVGVSFYSSDLDLRRRRAASLGHKFHPPNQLFQSSVSMPNTGA
jgi:hypothetical protein